MTDIANDNLLGATGRTGNCRRSRSLGRSGRLATAARAAERASRRQADEKLDELLDRIRGMTSPADGAADAGDRA